MRFEHGEARDDEDQASDQQHQPSPGAGAKSHHILILLHVSSHSPDSFTATPCAFSVLSCTSLASFSSATLSLWHSAFFPLCASFMISSCDSTPRDLRVSTPASLTPGDLRATFEGCEASSLPL